MGHRAAPGYALAARSAFRIAPSLGATARPPRRKNHPVKPVSPRTVNADQQCLTRILNEAVTDGHLARNPLSGFKKLREATQPRRYLAKHEVALVLKHAPPRFRPLVYAAIFTGARRCELTRLRWGDVDFEGGKIAITRTKVGNADSLDLHPLLARELRALRARRPDAKAGDHVFLSRLGRPYISVMRSWKLTLEAAGLAGREGLTFHSTRHTFATHFLDGGGAVTDLQAQLGHAELGTTQIYAASVSERRRSAVMGLDFGERSHHAAPVSAKASRRTG